MPTNNTPMVYDVRDYGAMGDGKVLDTVALQTAIDICSHAGGGTVVLPAGTYLTGALRLRSNLNLYISKGATLLGSAQLNDYYVDGELVGLLSARDAERITVCGDGILDGNGDAFADWTSFEPGGAAADRSKDGPVVMHPRPGNLVVFSNCRYIVIKDLLISNAPYWTVHLDGCRYAQLLDLKIHNNVLIPNNDGIHCTSSQNIVIRGCDILAGDDAIAITGINNHGPLIPGFIGYEQATENVLISDCILECCGCGVRIGYGHNDVRHCLLSNLLVRSSNRGIGVFTRNPGCVEDVQCSNLQIETRVFDGIWWGNGEPIHISTVREESDVPVGAIRRVSFHNIQAMGTNGILVQGCPEAPIEDLLFRDIELRLMVHPVAESRGGLIDTRPSSASHEGLVGSELAGLLAREVGELVVERFWCHGLVQMPDWLSKFVWVENFQRLLLLGMDFNRIDPIRNRVVLNSGQQAIIQTLLGSKSPAEFVAAEGVLQLDVN